MAGVIGIILLIRYIRQQRAQARLQEEVRNIFAEYFPVDTRGEFEQEKTDLYETLV